MYSGTDKFGWKKIYNKNRYNALKKKLLHRDIIKCALSFVAFSYLYIKYSKQTINIQL